MKQALHEDDIERIAIGYLRALSYTHLHGRTIASDGEHPVGPSVYVYGVCVVENQTACVMGQGGQMAVTGNGGRCPAADGRDDRGVGRGCVFYQRVDRTGQPGP